MSQTENEERNVRRQRRGIRTQVQSLLTSTDQLLATPNPEREQLQARLDSLFRYSSQLQGLDVTMWNFMENEDVADADMKECHDIQDRVRLYTVRLQNYLASRTEAETILQSEASFHTPSYHQQRQTAKLPTLQLPKFNGNPLEWSTFWDSFESAVHRSDLPPVDKFNYLKSLLQGTALDAITGIPVTNASYDTAIDIIKDRFGQMQMIINAHVASLVTLPESSNETTSLRHLYDSVEMHIRGLATLGITADTTAGQVLTPIILTKLPEEIRLILTRKHGTAVGDLTKLRELLKTEVEARELSRASMKRESPLSTDRNPNFTTGALVTQSIQINCVFCKGKHSSSSCRTVLDPCARKSILQRDNRCFRCLRSGHSASRCNSQISCSKCDRHHHISICQEGYSSHHSNNRSYPQTQKLSFQPCKTPRQYNDTRHSNTNRHSIQRNTTTAIVAENSIQEDTRSAHADTQSTTLVTTSTSNVILMQTALATTKDSSGNDHVVRLLFDTASQRSYITSELVKKLRLSSSKSESLCIAGFGQRHSSTQRYNATKILLEGRYDHSIYQMSTLVVPQITQPIFRTPIHGSSCAIVTKMQLADPPQESGWISVDILVGLDHYWDFVTGPITKIPGTELSAVRSSFGYLISGKNGPNPDPIVHTFFIQTNDPDETLQQFWNSETFEACETNDIDTNDSVLLNFENSIQKINGRYEVRFPWKEEEPSLPTNFKLCKNRFQGLVARLRKTDMVLRYDKVIKQQLDLGFIEPVNSNDTPNGILHYIPHHPVIKDDHATTKLRIVYDASARLSTNHPSLNDCLYSGPNLLADIHAMFIKFRTYPIVLLADIEKAFLQVVLQLIDRDATRFFWLKDTTLPPNDDNILVYRFCRVLFGATCSPFLLAATLRYHLKRHEDPAVQSMAEQFYVDNFCTGTNSASEAYNKYTVSKTVLSEVGMNLREWLSNSSTFMAMIPDADRSDTKSAKFLGLQWDTTTDVVFVKDVREPEANIKITKRHILHTISKVYDPLGIVSPVTVTTKILIQELWKLNLDWDSEVPSLIATRWKTLSSQLRCLSEAKVPRLLPQSSEFKELHIFVDASQKAYGAVAYYRLASINQFVCSKSRVAPVKSMTIPRLELSACVLGCKLAAFLLKTISPSNVFIWSDSQVVLCWINKMPHKQSVFVKNRVNVIQSHNFSHRYCPTHENPADLCSRGITLNELKANSLWWNGPAWLGFSSIHWPPIPHTTSESRTAQDNAGGSPVEQLVLVSVVRVISTPFGIDITRFNMLEKLLKVTVVCQQFIQRLKRNLISQSAVMNRECALQLWIKWIQESFFYREIILLKNQKQNKLTKEFQLHLKDGNLVSRGRFSHVADDSFRNDLLLLPTHHQFTNMIIMYHHNHLQHQGPRHTLSMIRERYWIPKGRQAVRSVLKKCIVCTFWEGSSFRLPITPSLPASRVSQSPPFSFTGCDFAGPVYVFDNGISSKNYICLFTCAVTRAVHLELVTDLTTQVFIMALQRFVHRRGIPVQIISDNAKTFKLAKSTLERMCHNIIKSPDYTSFIVDKGIDWRFNVERAPWWGGFFERMVGLVKRTLTKMVGKAKLTSIQLSTILTEIESILNSRPLTYVYSEMDSGEPLTPNNFLIPSKRTFFPPQVAQPDPDFNEDSAATLLSRLQYQERLLDYYWSMWRQEYLSLLRERHQQSQKKHSNASCAPEIGDVVLIREDGLKRCQWKMGTIEKVFPNKEDGLIRSAQVKTATSSFNRPITLLYPLEIKTRLNIGKPHTPPKSPKGSAKRPLRKAAIKASKALQSYYKDQVSEP